MQSTVVIADMMELINNISSIPDIYKDLVKLSVKKLPKCYKRIDIVADCYKYVRLFGENFNSLRLLKSQSLFQDHCSKKSGEQSNINRINFGVCKK